MLAFGEFSFDPSSRVLFRGTDPVSLGGRAADVLAILLDRPGAVIPPQEIMEAVWPDLFVEENNLHVQVSALRKVLGPEAIQNVARRGYRFAVEVRSTAAEPRSSRQRPPMGPGLIGRDEDARALADLLERSALVTLLGPGGVGKTALAATISRSFDSLVWADLSVVSDLPSLLLQVASAAGLPASAAECTRTLAQALCCEPLLLVLDNCDHVASAAASFCDAVTANGATVTCLATSQVRLNATGEQVYRLEGLAVDDADQPAVRLFRQRACAADQRFDGGQCEAKIEQVCRRLAGNPLAIELAANRAAVLGVGQVARELDERLSALATAAPAKPQRQRSLGAMLDWSVGLLAGDLRSAFEKLAVWRMPFELAVAEALLGPDAASLVAGLVEHSLASRSRDEPPRYSIADVARVYGVERLVRRGELAPIERAIETHRKLAQAAVAHSREHDALQHLSAALRLAPALPASAAKRAELALLLELGPALQTALSPASHRCRETYARAAQLAEEVGDTQQRFEAAWGLWHFFSMVGDEREAAARAAELRDLAERSEDRPLRIESLHASLTTNQLTGGVGGVLHDCTLLVQSYDPEAHHELAFRFGGHDPCVCALAQSALAHWLSGEEGEAALAIRRAMDLADQLDHAHSTAVACFYGAIAAHWLGDAPLFAMLSERLVRISTLRGMEALGLEARLLAGRAGYGQTGSAQALVEMTDAFDTLVESGERAFIPLYACLCAEALLAAGDEAGALRRLEEADDAIDGGQGLFVPEVLRLKAMMSKDAKAAAALISEGLATARAQGATALEARLQSCRA